MSGTVAGLAGLSPLALAMLGQQVMPQQSPGTLQGQTMPFASLQGGAPPPGMGAPGMGAQMPMMPGQQVPQQMIPQQQANPLSAMQGVPS